MCVHVQHTVEFLKLLLGAMLTQMSIARGQPLHACSLRHTASFFLSSAYNCNTCLKVRQGKLQAPHSLLPVSLYITLTCVLSAHKHSHRLQGKPSHNVMDAANLIAMKAASVMHTLSSVFICWDTNQPPYDSMRFAGRKWKQRRTQP